MAKLVNRFYDPQGGRVLVDGIDIRDVTLHSLRSQIGVVPQEPFLFAGSIRDNLVFANPDGDRRRRRRRRSTPSGCASSSTACPTGWTPSCTSAARRSRPGERQLLALGRAFLSHPRVLVLDEATSSASTCAARRSSSARSRALLEGRTAILIAHRLTTAKRADRIVVIEDGGIVESGSHDELVATRRPLRRDVRHLGPPGRPRRGRGRA